MKRLLTLLALALATATSFGATLNPIQLLNPAGSTAGQAIVSTGPSTAPAWAPVTATALAAQAANTVVANVTAASASPTAVALPSCSTANSALKYTTSTGFSCGTTYALTSGTLAQFAATTSAQLLGVISDETGTGSLVFGTNPTISGATFPGAIQINYPNATTPLQLSWNNNGSSRWIWQNDGTAETGSNAGSNIQLNARTDAGAFLSTPLSISRATGTMTLTGLAVSGAITPNQTIGIVGTTTNNNANGGSVGEYVTASGSAVSLTSGTAANITSINLTAGDWDVTGVIQFVPAGTTTTSTLFSEIGNATLCTTSTFDQTAVLRGIASAAGAGNTLPAPVARFSLSSTTTIYLCGAAQFATSTMTANGLIRARRVR
jgi:hypothetical protein